MIVITSGIYEFVLDSLLIDTHSAASSLGNILRNEFWFRFGLVWAVISGACYIAVSILLYAAFAPANKVVARLTAGFGLVGVAIGGNAWILRAVPLFVLHGERTLTSFTASQVETFGLMSLRFEGQVFTVGMVLFGFQCFGLGYLIRRSGLLPRTLGMLLSIGGLGYITSSCVNLLIPEFSPYISPFVLPVALVGEGSVAVWLILRGFNLSGGNPIGID